MAIDLDFPALTEITDLESHTKVVMSNPLWVFALKSQIMLNNDYFGMSSFGSINEIPALNQFLTIAINIKIKLGVY